MTCHCHAGSMLAGLAGTSAVPDLEAEQCAPSGWTIWLSGCLVELLAGHSESTQLWAAVSQQLCDELRL